MICLISYFRVWPVSVEPNSAPLFHPITTAQSLAFLSVPYGSSESRSVLFVFFSFLTSWLVIVCDDLFLYLGIIMV